MTYGLGRVGILSGGLSSEREISLRSGEAVYDALVSLGHDVVKIDPRDPYSLAKDIKDLGVKIAFIALHGKFGEDGTVQTILDEIGVPYTGSGPEASRLALNKVLSREVFIKHSIPVPKYNVLDKSSDIKTALNGFKVPVIIKPANEGSSIGMSIVERKRDLQKALDNAFVYDDNILVEEYIKADDITVGIFDNNPLPVIHIKPKEKYYSFEAKYTEGMSEYIVPAELPDGIAEEAQRLAALAHTCLGCRFFSRVDMLFQKRTKRIIVLEANTIPGLTSTSLLPKAAEAAGIEFPHLCLRMLESTLT